MKAFEGLLKRKNKALDVFRKTQKQLTSVLDEMTKASADAAKRIDEDKQKIAWLDQESASVLATIGKIKDITGEHT